MRKCLDDPPAVGYSDSFDKYDQDLLTSLEMENIKTKDDFKERLIRLIGKIFGFRIVEKY